MSLPPRPHPPKEGLGSGYTNFLLGPLVSPQRCQVGGGGAAPAPRCPCGPRLIPGSVLFRPFRNFNLSPPLSPASPWLFLIRFVVETAPACQETGSRSSPRAAPVGSVYLTPCQPSSGLRFPRSTHQVPTVLHLGGRAAPPSPGDPQPLGPQ